MRTKAMSKTIEEILVPKPTADLHLTRRRGGAEIRAPFPSRVTPRSPRFRVNPPNPIGGTR